MPQATAILLATQPAPWSDEVLALLPWSDAETLVEYHVRQLQEAGARDIEVVVGYRAEQVIPLLSADNVEPIIDDRWQTDPASALRIGATAVVRGTSAALVVDIAEPRPSPLLASLLDAFDTAEHAIVVSRVHGRRGSPVVLGERALAAMRNMRGSDDLSALLTKFDDIAELEINDDLADLRIDSRASYERARALLAG
jgi:CTP:molybdopterin cytidylyltransferase MocA